MRKSPQSGSRGAPEPALRGFARLPKAAGEPPTRKGHKCKICRPKLLFANVEGFVGHLRDQHCIREGGSFVCTYGENGVCQTLPVEGVSDADYDSHVKKCHLIFRDNNKSKLQSGSTDLVDYKKHSQAQTQGQRLSDSLSTTSPSFTVYSFTQNLSSVLSDPTRSKTETSSFFIRHWGDSFVPASHIPPASTIPRITLDHFRHYVSTTAKKHRQYLKARKALRKTLARHHEEAAVERAELPEIFLDAEFSILQPKYFNAIFLEPLPGEEDALISTAETARAAKNEGGGGGNVSRTESLTSINSTFSLQHVAPPDVLSGRSFRPYQTLNIKLEYFDDVVGSLLNRQLESKGEDFWKTVNSYTTLQEDLEEALSHVRLLRSSLACADKNIVEQACRAVRIHQARVNKAALLERLQDIACLRDAQATVQVLLNQNDFLKALECIEMARDVLDSDLTGVVCFRHLGTQLDELHKVIGRMLEEEFVGLIQKEFAKPVEVESDVSFQEAQLPPVIHGLLRCGEYRFLQVLRHEIVEAVSNSIRQIVKNRIVEYGADMSGFDPTNLTNLGDQVRQLPFDKWTATLKAIMRSLYLFCRRIISIQELILENVEAIIKIESHRTRLRDGPPAPTPAQAAPEVAIQRSESSLGVGEKTNLNVDGLKTSASSAVLMPNSSGPIASATFETTAAMQLSLPCASVEQVRTVLPCLLKHAVISAQERVGRLLTSKSKDGFIESVSPDAFCEVNICIHDFVDQLIGLLVEQKNSGVFAQFEMAETSENSTPLLATMRQQAVRMITHIHATRKQSLVACLDAEQWKPLPVTKDLQDVADGFAATGRLKKVLSTVPEQEIAAGEKLRLGEGDSDGFLLIGTAQVLVKLIGEYSHLLDLFPDCAADLLLHLVDVCTTFNSRTCQLILGAGAIQLVGLKSVSVRHLGLAARALQLIHRVLPAVRADFAATLPPDMHNLLRHFDRLGRDYADHVDEIYAKLTSVVDFHLVSALSGWHATGDPPTTPFRQIIRDVGRFYNSFSSIMPAEETTKLLLRIHGNFRSHFRSILEQRGVTPHDSVAYGIAAADLDYYMDNMRSLPDCRSFPTETITDILRTN